MEPQENKKKAEMASSINSKEERKNPGWKNGWRARVMDSVSPPPMPLLSIFCIVIFLLYLIYYVDYKEYAHRKTIGFKLLMLFLPVLLIFIARSVSSVERFVGYWMPRRAEDYELVNPRAEGSPWGVASLLVLLLVLISYHPSLLSKWFPYGV